MSNIQIWDDIFKMADDLPVDYNGVLSYQLAFVRNISLDHIDEYIRDLFNRICFNEEKFSSIGYFNIVTKFRPELEKREFKIENALSSFTKQVNIEEYIKLVNYAKNKYREVNVECPIDELEEYLVSKKIDELTNLEFVKYLTEKDNLDRYKKHLQELFAQNTGNHVVLPIIINRLKEMDELIEASNLQPQIILNMFNTEIKKNQSFLYDLISIRLSLPSFLDSSCNNIFVQYLNKDEQGGDLVINTANAIQNYVDFGNLLINLNTMNKYPLYKSIIHYLLNNKMGKKLYILNVLKKFEDICINGAIDPQLFISNLAGWIQQLKEKEGTYNFKETFSLSFVKEILKSDTEFAKYCVGQLKCYLDNLNKDKWKQSMKNNDYESLVIVELNYTYNVFANEAIHEILIEFAQNDIKSINRIQYEKIINHMSRKGINFTSTFNTVRDILCQKGELSPVDFLFWGEWLFQHSKLDTKQEVVRTILPVYLLDDSGCLKIITANREKLPKIIVNSGDESNLFINGLKARLEKNIFSIELKQLAETLHIKIPNDGEGQ